jgi:hypothetical protein
MNAPQLQIFPAIKAVPTSTANAASAPGFLNILSEMFLFGDAGAEKGTKAAPMQDLAQSNPGLPSSKSGAHQTTGNNAVNHATGKKPRHGGKKVKQAEDSSTSAAAQSASLVSLFPVLVPETSTPAPTANPGSAISPLAETSAINLQLSQVGTQQPLAGLVAPTATDAATEELTGLPTLGKAPDARTLPAEGSPANKAEQSAVVLRASESLPVAAKSEISGNVSAHGSAAKAKAAVATPEAAGPNIYSLSQQIPSANKPADPSHTAVANANTIPAAPHAKSFDHTPASTTAVHTEKATPVSDDKTFPVHSSAASDGHSSPQPGSSHQKSGDDKQQQQQFSNNTAAPQLQQSVRLQTTQAVQSPTAHQAGIAPAIAPQHATVNAPGHVQAMPSTVDAAPGKNLASQPASVPQYSPVINSSKLIEKLGESEIRIGLQTHDFGPVEIKTLLQNQELHAHISVEHTALRDALAADLPALQKSFEQQRIAVHSLNIQDHSTAWNGGGSSPRHSQQFSNPRNQLAPELKHEPRSTAADPVTPSQITGIDLHA